MKFSEQWLREWVNPPVSTDELVEQLTMAGLEVDSVEAAGEGLGDLLVAEVVSVDAHPDADKLRVCRVDAGQGEPLQIVCGAPNVQAGGKYPLAPVGARLPGDFRIKKSKLRGVESFGMLCSARELGLSDDHAGLMDLPADAVAGQRVVDLLGLDDALIEIDLTPNRGDCLGIEGIAREVGTLTRTPVNTVAIEPVSATIDDTFAVDIQAPDACPRYLGRVLRGVNAAAATPLWMQERLRRSGLRSLGPLVDITNYVLLELGQPMHAFDLGQLAGGIRVRYATAEEPLTLLDEREITLDTDTLVIADHDRTLAIAGVMGGLASGVTDATADLFLECAYFAPEAIAGCARKYALHTDSSHRFERGVDPQLQGRALEHATALLLEICGGKAGPVIESLSTDHLPAPAAIALRKQRIQRVLGMLPADDEIVDILERLGMRIQSSDTAGWQVLPPTYRFDVAIEADLIEEIGRVYGYNRLPSVPLQGALDIQPLDETAHSIDRFCDILAARGYQEAVTYSFVDPDLQRRVNPGLTPIPLANPISSEMAEMRTGLWPGLIAAMQHNVNRQKTRVRLFEHGLRFWSDNGDTRQEIMLAGIVSGSRLPEHWDGQGTGADFFDMKQDVEALLQYAGQCTTLEFMRGQHTALHPGQTACLQDGERVVGWLGRLHPQLADSLDLDPDTCLFELEYSTLSHGVLARFSPISRYPSIRRDLAVVVDAGLPAGELAAAVREAAGDLLQELVIFDVYQGKGVETGRKSIAFGLILQDYSRTLAEQDIEGAVTGVTDLLKEKFGASLRD
ncbi:MAG: phenylalanine--tRNA ligase subunit beta [Halobacteria archaeon]|nr:phenylalanine--tRNA ligase subunit beta [Halobacteria archaeon]